LRHGRTNIIVQRGKGPVEIGMHLF